MIKAQNTTEAWDGTHTLAVSGSAGD